MNNNIDKIEDLTTDVRHIKNYIVLLSEYFDDLTAADIGKPDMSEVICVVGRSALYQTIVSTVFDLIISTENELSAIVDATYADARKNNTKVQLDLSLCAHLHGSDDSDAASKTSIYELANRHIEVVQAAISKELYKNKDYVRAQKYIDRHLMKCDKDTVRALDDNICSIATSSQEAGYNIGFADAIRLMTACAASGSTIGIDMDPSELSIGTSDAPKAEQGG